MNSDMPFRYSIDAKYAVRDYSRLKSTYIAKNRVPLSLCLLSKGDCRPQIRFTFPIRARYGENKTETGKTRTGLPCAQTFHKP